MTLTARKETFIGAFPSSGVADISPVIAVICAEFIKADTLERASQTLLIEVGFLIAISMSMSVERFAVSFCDHASPVSGSLS